MSRTYKATGINLKSMPMGESDRLLTILTREYGLVRAVAMGSRKHNSKLGGRSGLFVVNELLIAKGRSLDKVTQAETLESYPKLAQDLKKLTASQYLAELSLCQALSDQPQEELFFLLNEHLKRLEAAPSDRVLAHLTQAVFQLLILAGISPQVHACTLTSAPLQPNLSDPNWRVGFSIPTGGVVTLEMLEQLRAKPIKRSPSSPNSAASSSAQSETPKSRSASRSGEDYLPEERSGRSSKVSEVQGNYSTPYATSSAALNLPLTATQLAVLQTLAETELPVFDFVGESESVWVAIERLLRQYAQYHFDRPIRSATLIDACFLPLSIPSQPSEL